MKVEVASSFFDSLKNLNSLKSKWYSLCGWFKYHFNKENFKLMREVFKGRPWDVTFLYDLEKAKINEMIAYHEKNKRYVGVEEDIKYMKICLNLIDIFTEKRDLFNYDGDIKYIPTTEDSTIFEIDTSDLKYHCNVYVNTKNVSRFIPFGENNKYIDYWKEHPHELYILKAKYLYHKIRFEKDDGWWD